MGAANRAAGLSEAILITFVGAARAKKRGGGKLVAEVERSRGLTIRSILHPPPVLYLRYPPSVTVPAAFPADKPLVACTAKLPQKPPYWHYPGVPLRLVLIKALNRPTRQVTLSSAN